MKVKQLNEKEVFEPITLEITIESEQDFCNLWHRMNLSTNSVNENTEHLLNYKCDDDGDNIFHTLNLLAEERNLYK